MSFLTMFPARLHGHLKSRCDPMHNQRSSVQKYRYFNQFISNHLKDFILDDIQTINFLPSRLYYDSVQIAITQKVVIKIRLRAVSSFSFKTLYNASNLSSFFAPLSSPRLALRKNGQPFTVYIINSVINSVINTIYSIVDRVRFKTTTDETQV